MRLSKWQTWSLFLPAIVIGLGSTFFINPSNFVFGVIVISVLFLISLTLAQKVDLHILIWNAPFTKNIQNACFIPGITVGSILGLLTYSITRILYGNEYMHNAILHIFSERLQIIRLATDPIIVPFITFITTSFILWIITRIQEISRSKAIVITIILTALLANIIWLVQALHPQYQSLEMFTLFIINALSTASLSWTLIQYSFEATLLANIIATILVILLSYYL